MPYGQPVELVAPVLPAWQEPVHQGHESGIVRKRAPTTTASTA
jgi:hypothetical protein